MLKTIGTLALAYSFVGQPSRAIDLLNRAESLGVRKGRVDITNLARLYLGLTSAAHADFGPALRHGQTVFDYWMGEGARPFFAWLCAILMALVHRQDGRVKEARAALAAGHQARMRSGFPHFFSGELLWLLEW